MFSVQHQCFLFQKEQIEKHKKNKKNQLQQNGVFL